MFCVYLDSVPASVCNLQELYPFASAPLGIPFYSVLVQVRKELSIFAFEPRRYKLNRRPTAPYPRHQNCHHGRHGRSCEIRESACTESRTLSRIVWCEDAPPDGRFGHHHNYSVFKFSFKKSRRQLLIWQNVK